MPDKVNFKWTETEEKYFDDIKQNFDHNTLLYNPDFNKQCDIHTNTRNLEV